MLDDGPASWAMLPPRALLSKGLAQTRVAEGVATPGGVGLVEESVADRASYQRPQHLEFGFQNLQQLIVLVGKR